MKKKLHTEEQIIALLKEHAARTEVGEIYRRGAYVETRFTGGRLSTENANIESSNGKFRENCLDQHWFRNLKEAERIITEWRNHYNNTRPHSSLAYVPPAVSPQTWKAVSSRECK